MKSVPDHRRIVELAHGLCLGRKLVSSVTDAASTWPILAEIFHVSLESSVQLQENTQG
jgi:hypothetical protein